MVTGPVGLAMLVGREFPRPGNRDLGKPVFKITVEYRQWLTAVIPALKNQRQEDCCEFKASVSHMVSSRMV